MDNGTFWLPRASSTVAGNVDELFYFILYLCFAFFVLIIGATVVFMVKYRRREGGPPVQQLTHSSTLELAWSVLPGILLMVIFAWGFKGYMAMVVAPGNSLQVNVEGRQWAWKFSYPGTPVETDVLVVPVGKPVKLIMNSVDVLHSFYIPEFRIKQDVIPGRYTTVWFESTNVGEKDIFCTEYCGTQHSGMITRIKVVEPAEYDAWLKAETEKVESMSDPVAIGERLYKTKACVGCHSLDGSVVVGPSFKGLWGKTESFTDGTSAVVDENYVRQSVMEPQAKIVAGFQGVMPTFQGQLSDKDVNSLIAYIQSVK